ncbi:MAG: tetratricopeptide repeat protein, partial [Gammaproteobacteria bacterium]
MTSRFARSLLLLIALSLMLSGCAWKKKSRSRADDGTIAGMISDLPELTVPKGEPVKPTRAEVLAAYEKVYGLIPDAVENHAVGKRLADLKMSVGEDLDIEGAENPYEEAVALYESLLENSEGEDRDQILYQLARAHDLVGETDAAVGYLNRLIAGYPDSTYAVESRFRRTEIAFASG